jgi:hypothetical protein
MSSPKIRITRTLVYEGSPEWIRETMAYSACSPGAPIEVIGNTITETERKEETITNA